MKDDKDKFHYGSMKKCYHSHPPLKIGGLVIYGGSCLNPVVLDADIYVGFEHSMRITTQAFPWNTGECFVFPIVDGQPPKSVAETRKLVEWLKVNLSAEKKVHIGCVGGHGRTGTILAALVKEMLGEEDAITYVRENYCVKAVESTAQVEWLHQHFGIKEVKASRSYGQRGVQSQSDPTTRWDRRYASPTVKAFTIPKGVVSAKSGGAAKSDQEVFKAEPQDTKYCIWGNNAI